MSTLAVSTFEPSFTNPYVVVGYCIAAIINIVVMALYSPSVAALSDVDIADGKRKGANPSIPVVEHPNHRANVIARRPCIDNHFSLRKNGYIWVACIWLRAELGRKS